MTVERPAGVTTVAFVFLAAATYLLAVGLTMLARPGVISMAAGAELLGGLELAGPYMFLLAGVVSALITFGLLLLHNWARWLSILVSAIGVVMLLPGVSSAVFESNFGKLAWGGLGTIVRMMMVWYLTQPDTRDAFKLR